MKTLFPIFCLLFAFFSLPSFADDLSKKNMENTVYLISVNKNGTDITSATGSIIDIQDNEHNNLILTAKHILWTYHGNYMKTVFAVVNNKGDVIAKAEPYEVARTKSDPSKEKGFMEQDIALLKISLTSATYRKINGFHIAENFLQKPSYAIIKKPFGIEKGSSGSPVLNDKNEVIGVVSNIFNNKEKNSLNNKIQYHSINLFETLDKNKKTYQTTTFPKENFVYIAPIIDKKIMKILKVKPQHYIPYVGNISIPSFSQDQPVIFYADYILAYPKNGIKNVDENHTNMDLEAILLMRKNGIINLGEKDLEKISITN